jgi:hypothetical protein
MELVRMSSFQSNAPIPSYGSDLPARPPAAAARDKAAALRQRLDGVEQKLVDALEGLVDRVSAPARAPNDPPPSVRLRQCANMLRTFRFCPRATCRKAQCCRGAPRHCLHIALPLMPDAAMDLARRRRLRRRR